MNMVFKAHGAIDVKSAPRAGRPFEVIAATEEVLNISEMMEQERGQQAFRGLLRVLVQERDAGLTEKIGTFREAQGVVRSEMERLAQVTPLDREALRQLGVSAHDCAEQAEVLILRMVQQNVAEVLVALVEEIFDSFRDAERLIEIAIKRGRP